MARADRMGGGGAVVGRVKLPCWNCGERQQGKPGQPRTCGACGAKRVDHPERLKPCPNCGRKKEPGKRRLCVACARVAATREYQREQETARNRAKGINPRRRLNDDAPEGTRWCSRCKAFVSLDMFTPNLGQKNKWAPACTACTAKYHRAYLLRKKFGLTLEDYDDMLAAQDGRCAICLRKPRKQVLAVDHDHKSGGIRGLLCNFCNHRLLGAAHEDPAILRRAADYLDSYAVQAESETGAA